jgi:hypothetical protein
VKQVIIKTKDAEIASTDRQSITDDVYTYIKLISIKTYKTNQLTESIVYERKH